MSFERSQYETVLLDEVTERRLRSAAQRIIELPTVEVSYQTDRHQGLYWNNGRETKNLPIVSIGGTVFSVAYQKPLRPKRFSTYSEYTIGMARTSASQMEILARVSNERRVQMLMQTTDEGHLVANPSDVPNLLSEYRTALLAHAGMHYVETLTVSGSN